MTSTIAPTGTTPSKHPPAVVDWHALKILNQYRLLLLVVVAAIYYLADSQSALGQRNPAVFQFAHTAYLLCAVLFAYLITNHRPAPVTQFYLHSYFDIVFITLLIYASGGVQSGLGPLMLVAIALISQLTSVRYAMLFAAMASSAILAAELYTRLTYGSWASHFELTALFGALLFATAWMMTVPLRQLLTRHRHEPATLRSALDVEQISLLNEEIIRELDSGVLVVDSANQVQLINDTARTLLAAEFTRVPLHIGRLSSCLFANLQEAKRTPTAGTRPFKVEDTGASLLPQYIPLSSGGMLVKLDDHAQIKKQFQQLKLASLGRLSASIAHEIRNPLGAISHAVQLLQESDGIAANDANLLSVAQRHTSRINGIVEDVLQLSNRQQVSSELVDLATVVTVFRERFLRENGLSENRVTLYIGDGVTARFDANHLDQVLWNLCTNAQLHNEGLNPNVEISCWLTRTGVTLIDVIDDGRGISDMDREQLFEPFYSTHHSGSGLGLYILRELCELNNASIECLEHEGGAHFRVSLATTRQMAA